MADHIQVERGMPPWRPSPESRLIAEHEYYDVPLSGILEQHGVEFAFRCLDGATTPFSVWIYFHVTAEERSRLESAEGPEEYGRLMTPEHRPIPWVLAIAYEGAGILTHRVVDDARELSTVVRDLVAELEGFLLEAAEDFAAA